MRVVFRPILPNLSPHKGQALAELVILLVVLVVLISGITTLSQICFRQERLQQDVRLEAGKAALTRQTEGWIDEENRPNNRTDTFHRINSYTRLEDYAPAPTSRLPMSHYTLQARDLPEGDLGLKETTVRKTYLLDETFIQWVYGKGTITISEQLTFPATSGIWE